MAEKASFTPFVASAPGKVIITGEHSVVYNKRAIATALGLRTFALFAHGEPGTVRIELELDDKQIDVCVTSAQLTPVFQAGSDAAANPCPEIDESAITALRERISSFVSTLPGVDAHPASEISLRVVLFLVASFGQLERGLRITVGTQLPVGAGLGSSAAFSCSLVAGFGYLSAQGGESGSEVPEWCPATLFGSSPSSQAAALGASSAPGSAAYTEMLNKWAFECERIIHGTPSGVDNTVSMLGRAVSFARGQPFEHTQRMPALPILITNTTVPRSTRQLVAGVRTLRDAHPAVLDPVLDAMHELSLEMWSLLQALAAEEQETATPSQGADTAAEAPKSTIDKVGELWTLNQHLLNAIGVGHASIDRVVAECSSARGMPTKLTGAGGGGCVITLLSGASAETKSAAEEALKAQGMVTIECTIGAPGAGVTLLEAASVARATADPRELLHSLVAG